MALKKAENIDTNLYQLEIAVDGDKFNDAVTKVFNRQKKNISIPGFRKGKAPRGMIEKYYGEASSTMTLLSSSSRRSSPTLWKRPALRSSTTPTTSTSRKWTRTA